MKYITWYETNIKFEVNNDIGEYIMTVRELIKENPWKALIGSVSIGTIIFTLVGTIFSEMRYATAIDLKQYRAETAVVIEDLQKQIAELSKKQGK